ncbi:MAG: dihydrolipoyllysine-residue succinyltransferase component of 2-oxoglutarate dehydrogenase complex [Candidatus Binatia bacterium]|nr:MAG: dihydrolipoyllysine-residue succinyltransferase component of 2-oxoglutarate dehydrogenase complex [Fimbriimonadales bacterium]GIW44208.1 MAG: dihydrolipoyllysine-residue succinyltransferase component of 2-oxoglutarate dehydrogenase complex [Candidatus Binatia bacterium]
MPVEVRIPSLGESITQGVIVRWIKQEGEYVQADEPILELETDKASVEIPATSSGLLHIVQPEGATVEVGAVVATIEPQAAQQPAGPSATAAASPKSAAAEPPRASVTEPRAPSAVGQQPAPPAASPLLSPAVRRLVEEHGLDVSQIPGTGKGGRLTKADVLAYLERQQAAPQPEPPPSPPPPPTPSPGPAPSAAETTAAVRAPTPMQREEGEEERVPMSHLRKRIAERLVQAQHTAAILTTFNEIDMSQVMALRAQYRERFQKRYGVSLGFMSFFAKACVAALQEIPVVNAFIEGDQIVYHKHVHLGIAVATERGLVVPVIHYADQRSFAEIESEIERLATLARQGKLGIQDISGGTFTITNGGVFGSLLSTPILNPPQSGILGMHKIEKRPVVVDDQIVIRPMMYVALSYDHRLVDGEQAVTFLVRVKERIEDPARLLLGV